MTAGGAEGGGVSHLGAIAAGWHFGRMSMDIEFALNDAAYAAFGALVREWFGIGPGWDLTNDNCQFTIRL